jgi:tetratricopeptide (TPR) repeat protein
MPKTQPKAKVRISSETPSAGLKPIPGPNAAGSTQDTLANQPLSAEAGKSRASSRSRTRTAKPRSRPTRSGRSTLIKRYEAAVRLLYRQQFERARAAFEKVISTDGQDKEICERALTHIRLCEQKITRSHPAPKSAEELYNVAIILMNNGRYRESMQYLKRALKRDPKCDYVIYALAVCNCRLGNTNRALKNLELAIDLKVENRFLAQRDSDFELLTRNSRFVSLVYPEEPTAATS